MAKTRVGINGFGRIGRNFFRAALERGADFDVVAFNDLGDVPTMAHLLRHDSVLGPFDGTVEVESGSLKVNGNELKGLAERDPASLPWGDLGVPRIGDYKEPVQVNPTTREFFSQLGRVWPNRQERTAMADVASTDTRRIQRGARVLAGIPVFDAVLRNGISPTIVQGGIRTNVIPTEASAKLNIRTLPGQSIDSVVRRLQRVVNDTMVTITVTDRGEDSPASDFHSPMFAAIRESVQALDATMTVVPYLSTGATDSARLRAWGMQAFGLLPFPMNQDDEDRMHGNDERIPLASLDFGTRMIYGAILRVAR